MWKYADYKQVRMPNKYYKSLCEFTIASSKSKKPVFTIHIWPCTWKKLITILKAAKFHLECRSPEKP